MFWVIHFVFNFVIFFRVCFFLFFFFGKHKKKDCYGNVIQRKFVKSNNLDVKLLL